MYPDPPYVLVPSHPSSALATPFSQNKTKFKRKKTYTWAVDIHTDLACGRTINPDKVLGSNSDSDVTMAPGVFCFNEANAVGDLLCSKY